MSAGAGAERRDHDAGRFPAPLWRQRKADTALAESGQGLDQVGQDRPSRSSFHTMSTSPSFKPIVGKEGVRSHFHGSTQCLVNLDLVLRQFRVFLQSCLCTYL
jgi:hypothetical protein